MTDRLWKIYSGVMYLQSGISGFLLGVLYTLVTGTAKDQGLAGGAIVLFNGLTGILVCLLASVFLAYKTGAKVVRTINWVLFMLNLILVVMLVRAGR